MRTAGVVIVGAGVMGGSTAYHLAARGCRNVLVVERCARPGSGSTGKASGGFRAQFTTDVYVRLSILARAKLLRFRDEIGTDPGYRPVGYLFMARTAGQLRILRDALAVQRAAGLAEAHEVSPDGILELSPAVRPDGWIGGTFCPTDGYLVPTAILHGYLDAAARLGVRFEYGAGDVDVVVDRNGSRPRVTGVRAAGEEVAAPVVVNAAGPWAGVLARRAGVEVPVAPLRRQTAATYPFPRLPDETPMTINVDDGFHLRVRDGRTLLLWPQDTAGAGPFDTTFDPSWLAGALAHAHACVPSLRETALDPQYHLCGLYEMSPDKHAILGPAPGLEGLYLINGSSGHGVMHSPVLGQLLAEMILDGGARTLDVRALRPSRFAEGDLNRDTSVL